MSNNSFSNNVRNQPKSAKQYNSNVWNFENEWHHKLCDCCGSCKRCSCAFFCTLCYFCFLYERAGESKCAVLIPCSLMSLRAKIRTTFRIKGNLCKDCCTSTFCALCVGIQIDNELDEREIIDDVNNNDNNRRNDSGFNFGNNNNNSRKVQDIDRNISRVDNNNNNRYSKNKYNDNPDDDDYYYSKYERR